MLEPPAAGAGASTLTPVAAETDADASAVTIDNVHAAAERIAPYVHRTPLLPSRALGQMTSTRLALKAENLQRTGSFKARGGLNAVLQLSPEQRERGVITLSAGNHGQGLAYAAQIAGVRCVVFVPESAVPTKIAAIRGYGAEVRFAASMETVFAAMEEHRLLHGMHYVHPFDDPHVIAGQGTVGLEIVAEAPGVEAIAVCAGGGGLLAGVAIAAKAHNPDIRVIGVEPEGAPAVTRSLAAGAPVVLEKITTIADGLSAPFGAPVSLALIRRYVDDVVLVADDDILAAMRLILERTKLLVEPAGAAAVAALLTNRAALDQGMETVATLSGGNIDLARLKGLL
jgi:threonine dehydratase